MTLKRSPGREEPPVALAFTERLCAVRAAATSIDPICTGGFVSRLLAVEIPTPWQHGISRVADAEGEIAHRIAAIQRQYKERRRREEIPVPATGNVAIYGIAPDPEWSSPKERRIIIGSRPESAFAEYVMAEYIFPFDSLDIVHLVDAYFHAPECLETFDSYRVDSAVKRELFICTDGAHDICCAKFGVPLYRQARAAYPAVRAWRTMHIGGHRYAPTAWEFPSGYKWGFLDEGATHAVLHRENPAVLDKKLRGWAGAPPPVQALDRVGFLSLGWDWLSFSRHGTVLESDEDSAGWRVRLDFESPDGVRGAWEGQVGIGREISVDGCGPHWGERPDARAKEFTLRSYRSVIPR